MLLKKLAVVAGGIAAAIGFSLSGTVPAKAEPYVPCPFDMTTEAGRQALKQSFDNYSAQVRAINNKANNRPVEEREAFSKSPQGIEMMARANQLIAERTQQSATCWDTLTLRAPAPVDDFNPAPLDPLPDRPMIVDSYAPPTSNVDCTKLRAAYDALGPVTDATDAAAKLNHMKIPGLSLITGISLAQCGLDAIPAAIDNPSLDNQQRVFDGACGAVDNVTNGIINPCGDTPVN